MSVRCGAIVFGMTHSASSPRPAPPLLLAVHDLREEVRAGFGQTALVVRTLDGVSLEVRAGELVVLKGGVASGVVSLLGALAGTRRVWSGNRIAARGVQVRRGSISDVAFRALTAAWSARREIAVSPVLRDDTPTVYLFRVRRRECAATPTTPRSLVARTDEAAWRTWADSLRARGGSVLAHVQAQASELNNHAGAVHEATGSEYAVESRGVRVLTLAAGRIVNADGAVHSMHSRTASIPSSRRQIVYIQGSPLADDAGPGS